MAEAFLLKGSPENLSWSLQDMRSRRSGLLKGKPESWMVWGVLVRTVLVWHQTWSVNSLSHLFGYRTYVTGENSRNNWLVALIAAGEGWHNNHHHDPVSASVQHRWWEFDLTYYCICSLSWLGLASDIILPRHIRKAHDRTVPRTVAEIMAVDDSLSRGHVSG